MTVVEPAEPVNREQMRAVAQVQRWHDFTAHVGAYLLINAVLIVIWAVTGGGTFWPGVSLAAWGLGLSSQHFLNSFSPISVDAGLARWPPAVASPPCTPLSDMARSTVGAYAERPIAPRGAPGFGRSGRRTREAPGASLP